MTPTAQLEALVEALRDLMWRFDDDDSDPHALEETAPDILSARAALSAAPALVERVRRAEDAADDYGREEQYLVRTAMHDNYTDRARARDRQAKALRSMLAALAPPQPADAGGGEA